MRFLIIDDDDRFRGILRYYIEVRWPDAIIEQLKPSSRWTQCGEVDIDEYDCVLLGYPLVGEIGFEWLREFHARGNSPPVIVFARKSNEYLAVDAIKAGAASYFPKKGLRYRRLIETIRMEMGSGVSGSTGASFVQQLSQRAGRDYRYVETLHSSDFASLYLAATGDERGRVVFKVLRHVPDSGGEDMFDRFIQEYELIASIDHPNVVRIFDLGVADDHAYIEMEYFSGGNLARRLDGPLSPALAREYAIQIASALQAIHDAGVLHRDLKPANIMFRKDGSLALIDFGLATQVELATVITGSGQIFGTPYYMSPEQGHGQEVDARSDIYSLGCICYEMLTGTRPFIASSAMGVIYRHAHGPRPQLNGQLESFGCVIERMFARRPEERYADAASLLTDLQALPYDRAGV